MPPHQMGHPVMGAIGPRRTAVFIGRICRKSYIGRSASPLEKHRLALKNHNLVRFPYRWFPFCASLSLRFNTDVQSIHLRFASDDSSIVLRSFLDSRTELERSSNGGLTEDERRTNEERTENERRTNEERCGNIPSELLGALQYCFIVNNFSGVNKSRFWDIPLSTTKNQQNHVAHLSDFNPPPNKIKDEI